MPGFLLPILDNSIFRTLIPTLSRNVLLRFRPCRCNLSLRPNEPGISRQAGEASMTITEASRVIAEAVQAGRIDRETAGRAQDAIRGRHYGMRLSASDRASILRNRFGIEVAS